jgi:hypothetical protein
VEEWKKEEREGSSKRIRECERGREGVKRIDGIVRKQGSREVIKALIWWI